MQLVLAAVRLKAVVFGLMYSFADLTCLVPSSYLHVLFIVVAGYWSLRLFCVAITTLLLGFSSLCFLLRMIYC